MVGFLSTCQCVQSFSSPPATILTFSSLRRSPTTTSRCGRSAQSGISSEGVRPPQSRDPRNKYIDLRRCRYLPQRQTPSRHGPSLNKPMNRRRHAQQGYPYPPHKLLQGLHRRRKPLSRRRTVHPPLDSLPLRRDLNQRRRLQETSQLPQMLRMLNKEAGLKFIRKQSQRAART